MIERLLTNEQSLRRWRRFKRNKRAVVSCWVLGCLLVLSATAEIWANNKPSSCTIRPRRTTQPSHTIIRRSLAVRSCCRWTTAPYSWARVIGPCGH